MFFIFIIEKTCFYINLIFIILKMFYLYYFRAVLKLFPFFVLKIYIFDIFSRIINLLNFRKHFIRFLKNWKFFYYYYYLFLRNQIDKG